MQALRVVVSSLAVLLLGGSTFWYVTDSLRAYTSETARRIDVEEHPRPVPEVVLQTSSGQDVVFSSLRGRWVVVEFIYTRCMSFCFAQGSELSSMQETLKDGISNNRVQLLSVSFDREYDVPVRLKAYQQRYSNSTEGWFVARPATDSDLRTMLDVFSVVVIPDGMGGYVHNAAIAVVNPEGKLIAIHDWNKADDVAKMINSRLPI